jgi:hypothetical protein
LPVQGKAGAGGRFRQQTIEFDVLDFIAPSALLSQQQRP